MWTKENIPDLMGKVVIVTGSNTGIGYETALDLYEKGGKCHMDLTVKTNTQVIPLFPNIPLRACKTKTSLINSGVMPKKQSKLNFPINIYN